MYFDCVQDKQRNILFNGTPDETRAWLEEYGDNETMLVFYGQTLEDVTVEQYLADAM
jgi:hypothetical protein